MDVLIERCAGLDVHRDTVVAAVVATVRRPGPGGVRRSETRTFTTMTGQLETLADWLTAEKVTLVGMESTGIYWKPVYYVLEDRVPVWVINAEHLRNVPGRKTDVADSMWIAQLIEHGLVSPSFVPPRNVRLLRDVTRHGRRSPRNAPGRSSGWRRCCRTPGSNSPRWPRRSWARPGGRSWPRCWPARRTRPCWPSWRRAGC